MAIILQLHMCTDWSYDEQYVKNTYEIKIQTR